MLNNRLSNLVESNAYVVDKQHGFQKGTSAIDRLSTLTSCLESMTLQKDTDVAYIGFLKVHD